MSKNELTKKNYKGIPWMKIKAEYLQGVTPKELAQKYHTTSKVIRDKANQGNWYRQKSTISDNIQQKTENKIQNLTDKALNALEQVIDDTMADYKDKVSAAKAILDISGLKSSKQDLNINNEPIEVKFI